MKQEEIYYDPVASKPEHETDDTEEPYEGQKKATDRERRREQQVPSAANQGLLHRIGRKWTPTF